MAAFGISGSKLERLQWGRVLTIWIGIGSGLAAKDED